MTETIASRIRASLNKQHMTQRELARRAGVSPQAISKWMRGGNIEPDHLRRAARALSVNHLWLQYGAEAEQVGPRSELIQQWEKMPDAAREYLSGTMENVREFAERHPLLASLMFSGNLAASPDTALEELLMHRDGLGYSERTTQGKVVRCNEAFARILGKSAAADVEGRQLSDFYPAAHQRVLNMRSAKVLDDGHDSAHLDRIDERFVYECIMPGSSKTVHVFTQDLTDQINTLLG